MAHLRQDLLVTATIETNPRLVLYLEAGKSSRKCELALVRKNKGWNLLNCEFLTIHTQGLYPYSF